jgi:hypothetical protein
MVNPDVEKLLSTGFFEKVGVASAHSYEAGKTPGWSVATRNLEQSSVGIGSDFNVSHPLWWAEITDGVF